jgi:hypothetical protein
MFLKSLIGGDHASVNFNGQTFNIPKDRIVEVADPHIATAMQNSGWLVPTFDEMQASEAGIAWARRAVVAADKAAAIAASEKAAAEAASAS